MLYLADMQSPGTVRLSHRAPAGGSAISLGAADLARVLATFRQPSDPHVLAGGATSDDAGVYQIAKNLALIQTVDFFTPLVDDPYDFGRIAATSALGNVYAMGGTPITALNVIAFPIDKLDEAILRRILEGGAAVVAEAGVALLGSHAIADDEPHYGLAVTGTCPPDRIVTNAGARPGDLLLLTKPIGGGILTTARRRDGITDAQLAGCVAEMTRSNAAARDAMLAHGAHAATGIAGYGLLGHAFEISRASHVGVEIESAVVPLFAQTLELIDSDFVPGATEANLAAHGEFTSFADYVTGAIRVALSDAATSGGLLISGDARAIRAMQADLAPTHRCAIVGRITEDGDGTISVL
jgi:selenide,water dikinase